MLKCEIHPTTRDNTMHPDTAPRCPRVSARLDPSITPRRRRRARLIPLIATALRITRPDAAMRYDDFIRFLQMCGRDTGLVAPSRPIDEVWHAVLDQAPDVYRELCVAEAGVYVRHVEASSLELPRLRPTTRRSRRLALRMFGPAYASQWPRAMRQGSMKCCSRCDRLNDEGQTCLLSL